MKQNTQLTRLAASGLSLAVVLLLLACAPALTQDRVEGEMPNQAQHDNVGADGLALEGFDPVSYFSEGGGEPKEGAKDITATHREATYRFATEKHRELFDANPERYVPAYGGWCAYAIADGEKVEVDPEAFIIQNDRLMVFYRTLLTDTRKPWKKDAEAYENKADTQWDKITGEQKPEDE